MDDISEQVEQQYTAYPYPDYRDISGKIQGADPSRWTPLLWPEGRPRQDLTILVAGCGTVQAAMIAKANTECTVIGVDLSETSLAHEQMLKERHGLTNLVLHRMDLRDVGSLDASFDLIYSTGVLHHMRDPAEGLHALGSVLRPEGAMVLMLYGATRRHGVYLMQDVFRRLKVKQDSEGVAFVRRALNALPADHFVHLYLGTSSGRPPGDLAADAGIVDTFLHPHDRSYTVPEVLELVESVGLRFQRWIENGWYYPDALLPARSAFYKAIIALPEREQWSVCEKVGLLSGVHVLVVCRPERDPGGYSFAVGTSEFWGYIPWVAYDVRRVEPGKYVREKGTFSLPEAADLLYSQIDGTRSIEQCFLRAAIPNVSRESAVGFFSTMWRKGHLHLSKVSVPAARTV